jgi:hypothetical protein
MSSRREYECDWGRCVPATWSATRVPDGPLEKARRCACATHLDALLDFIETQAGVHYDFQRLCRPDGRRPR